MMPELINHLWQSTVFAIFAGLLTLAFRKNRAQVRYWIWFSASVKFLVPFSLLLTLGGYFGRTPAAKAVPVPAISSTVVQVVEPFPEIPSPAASPQPNVNWIPTALVSLWACGVAGVVWIRLRGWRRIRAAVRASTPIEIKFPVPVRSTTCLLEPGVVGIFRPMLLLPAGILERLAPNHLESILAHELCHVRRRDNLTALIHMIVETAFWFHPFIWLVSARLVEERERACDEAVLELGSEPKVYAESILKTCEFCVESPLACVSGVTGADLKKRIVHIMTESGVNKLSLSKKVLLVGAGIAALAGPMVFGLMGPLQTRAKTPPPAVFDVVSIRVVPPNAPPVMVAQDFTPVLPGGHYMDSRTNLFFMIAFAYNVKNPSLQLVGLPKWAKGQTYSVDAKSAEGFPDLPPEENREQVRLMLRAMLSDRFHLQVHTESRQQPVFNLVLANGGLKLKQVDPPVPPATEGHVGAAMSDSSGRMVGKKSTMAGMASALTLFLKRPVYDQTGLKGFYDFDVSWTAPPPPDGQPPARGLGPDGIAMLISNLHDQFGLRLTEANGPVQYWVVDHVEQPTEN